jgi:NADH-quinone oxidoreductase subunit F
MQKLESVGDLEVLRKSILDKRDPQKPVIAICGGSGCYAYGCVDLIKTFRQEVKDRNLESEVEVRATGCPGF